MVYLTNQSSFKIIYRRGMKLVDLLSGYADADCGNISSHRSTSGMVKLYNKSQIMWKSKTQKTTALSTAEAEYYSASIAGCEVLYLICTVPESHRRGLLLYTRTNPRALSGVTSHWRTGTCQAYRHQEALRT